MCEASTKYVPN